MILLLFLLVFIVNSGRFWSRKEVTTFREGEEDLIGNDKEIFCGKKFGARKIILSIQDFSSWGLLASTYWAHFVALDPDLE